MKLNPYEQGTLMNLIAALGSGMDPTFGYSVLSGVTDASQQRAAERQARMGALTDLLVQQAQSGLNYAGNRAMANAYTRRPGVPPQLQDVLNSLYPMVNVRTTGVTEPERDMALGLAGNIADFL